jgi:mersacidin/lichenicidin family type 2 lantibiotic
MVDIVRFWKDPSYRAGLSEGPANPAGTVELTDDQLKAASGLSAAILTTCRCCSDTSRSRHCCP